VVLPEGATNIKTVLPFPVDSEGSDVKYTYLDVTGRPVVVLTKRNAAPEHNAKFSVDYSFSTASIVREPLLLVAGAWRENYLLPGACQPFMPGSAQRVDYYTSARWQL
jgi:oligosaccharyltransferase complex subunit alpha (ribophorin I)